jgi:hypothetical protein
MEHRLVMQRHIGRVLLPDEVVHHRNGDRLDNRIDNLEIIPSHSIHLREHQRKARWRCVGCGVAFEAKPSQHRKFCSRTCYQRTHAGHDHAYVWPEPERLPPP